MADIPITKMILVGLLPPPLKRMYYRFRGAKIGKGVRIGWFSYISSPQIILDDYSSIGHFTFIKTRESFLLGARSSIQMLSAIDTGKVEIGSDSTVMEQVIIGGMLTPRSRLKVGKRVKIFAHSFINPTEPITIDDDVGIGGANYLFTHGTWQNAIEGYPSVFGPIHIKKNSWLQWRVFIGPNVTIGEDSIVQADSNVGKSFPDGSLIGGVPAALLKSRAEYKLEFSESQKIRQLLKIMKQFSDYLTYVGRGAAFSTVEYGALIKSDLGLIQVVTNSGFDKDSFDESSVVLSFKTEFDSLIEPLLRAGTSFFSIGGQVIKSEYPLRPLLNELRNYLSRYGVRFDVEHPQ